MVQGDATLRADAQANRDRILDVAREALSADPAASLNSIAKTAGVGAGTLYRHFPHRDALVVGVYRKEIEGLVQQAGALLAAHPPLVALRAWCDCLARSGRTKQALSVLLEGALTARDTQEAYLPTLAAARALIEACLEAGAIKPGLDAADFLALVSFLWRLPATAEGEARARKLLLFVFKAMATAPAEIDD